MSKSNKYMHTHTQFYLGCSCSKVDISYPQSVWRDVGSEKTFFPSGRDFESQEYEFTSDVWRPQCGLRMICEFFPSTPLKWKGQWSLPTKRKGIQDVWVVWLVGPQNGLNEDVMSCSGSDDFDIRIVSPWHSNGSISFSDTVHPWRVILA